MFNLTENAEVIVIGTSAGGVDILKNILPAIKKSQHLKVALVIHLPPEGPNLIPSLMGPSCDLTITEAEPGEPMLSDHIYVSPTDYHLLLESNYTLSLSNEELVNFSRPSIDLLFESAAYAFGKKAVGILLTGANHDGAQGLKKIKEMGGLTIIQDPSEAEYKAMPESALEIMKPDLILSTKKLADLLTEISMIRRVHA